ncbi:hypothetical protein CL654_02780 [bacterium]|mgnify:CR=1 FL=1|nr:hypothetical protein [bacterium]|tara:strand:- start:5920 stop:6861 length:942 start_codon:yes stop_codon:yes gene_type:complete
MELLIVTYHYILPEDTYEKGIYPVSKERFSSHLETLSKTHTFISEKDLIDAIENGKKLPEKACLISFDDGLRCQFENAVPVLEEKNIPAVFFVSTRPYTDKKAAVVHKVHYLLAHVEATDLLEGLSDAYKKITKEDINWSLVNKDKIKRWYIYDDEETAVFKYLLNHFLPSNIAEDITEDLFATFYSAHEEDFCKELYFLPEQIESIKKNKLFSIGLHSHSHLDISKHSTDDVVGDFRKNKEVLTNTFRLEDLKGLSYPYGITDKDGEDQKIKKVADELSLVYGVTTEKGINTDLKERLTLKRFNPNDIQVLE